MKHCSLTDDNGSFLIINENTAPRIKKFKGAVLIFNKEKSIYLICYFLFIQRVTDLLVDF